MTFDTALSGSGIVAARIGARVADSLFAAPAARSLMRSARWTQAIRDVAGFELPDVTITLTTSWSEKSAPGTTSWRICPPRPRRRARKAMDGARRALRPPGPRRSGQLAAGKGETGQIHYGADDNASGTAAVLAAGEALAKASRERNVAPRLLVRRGIGFARFGGVHRRRAHPDRSSRGLSQLRHGRPHAGQQADRAGDRHEPAWPRILERENVAAGFDLAVQEDPYQPTDVASFNQAGVPSLNFFTGAHADYHRPSDTADKIDYEALDRVAAYAAAIARRVAALDPAPVFAKVEQRATGRPSRAACESSPARSPTTPPTSTACG